MKRLRIILIIASLLVSGTSIAGRVDKGYKALYLFDYFSAKTYFTKALKYNESPGAQGLAIIFYRDDNPFHSYDSALVYIQRSIATFDMVKERKRIKYAPYGFTKDSLYALRQKVSSRFFENVMDTFTVASFDGFIHRHSWAREVSEAIRLRDSLAFFQAVSENTSSAYKDFMETYPKSEYYELAGDNYYGVQFIEMTSDGTLLSFNSFIENNPASPLLLEAQTKQFELATQDNTPAVYEAFIQDYPESPFIEDAWRRWYQLELRDYSRDVITFFIDSTEFPFKDELIQDRLLFDVTYLPYTENRKFGYMDNEGKLRISPSYDYGSFFQEGLAIVAKEDKFGFVNKRGELQIPCEFTTVSDFVKGLAIVEINERYGMIDRNGAYVFDVIYEDLGLLSEGLSYALVAERYGYYTPDGTMVIPHIFDDAYDFKDGKAKVEVDGLEGYIDTSGNFVIPAVHETIQWYQDTMLVFSDEGLYGLMNDKAQIFVEPQYDWINPMHEGLAVTAIEGRIVYLDSSGTIVIDNGFTEFPNYQLKGEMNDGIAVVMKKEKYGRINRDGKIVTECKFENIGIGKKVFPAKKDGFWGLFNEQGKAVVSTQYDGIYSSLNATFIVTVDDTMGVIDSRGNAVIPMVFDEIEPIRDNLFLVKKGDKAGVYRGEELIVPAYYDQIGLFNEEYLFLNKGGVLSYYDLIGDKLVERKE